MEVKCIPKKQLFSNYLNGYRVVSCNLAEPNDEVETNNWGNFTISGSNINSLKLNEVATLNIELDAKSKYPASYILTGYGGVSAEDGEINVDPRYELEILSRLMETRQAEYVNEAYPNFVSMVLNGREEELDHRRIYNVGPKRLPEYIQKVKDDSSNILYYPIATEAGIGSSEDVTKLRLAFANPDDLREALKSNPYHVYMDLVHFPFAKTDELVLKKHPELRDSQVRCEYGCLEILRQNELLGDTRLEANIMASEARKIIPESYHYMVKAVTESEVIHYDPETKHAAIRTTYEDEQCIAKALKERVGTKIPNFYPMNWEKFKEVDGFECTEEQTEILRIIANGGRTAILTGGAGCVDADTEFFTGYGWKRIADYQEGDKVLQYNKDGTAELVEPWRYIKEPCDKMYHFETNKSVNQTVTDDHRILYCWGNNDKILETNVVALKEKSENNTNWAGKFLTTFHKQGKGIPLTDEQIRVMVCVMAEGHFDKGCPNSDWVVIRLKKERKRNRIVQLLEEASIPYKYRYSEKEDVHIYKFHAPERRKVYGGKWWDVNAEQSKIIEEEITNWDGTIVSSRVHNKKKPLFRTTEKQSADYIQFIFCNNGWQATIKTSHNESSKPVYLVSTSHTKRASLCFDNRPTKTKTKFEEVVPSDGFKYCFTVPSHMLVLRRKDCIFVTGNCGKTSSVKALIRMLEDNNYSYTLLAPTGIAARRLRESTGRAASTIHMFLATESAPGNYVIVDECSMLSVGLLARLIRAIGDKPNIIFVCDEAQLASISCGNIVKDCIDSNIIPRANLTKVFRYGTQGLATIATDARFGKSKSLHNSFDDFKFIPISSDPIGQVLKEYGELLEQGYKKDEILILSPFNKGTKGTYEINKAIQARYNDNDYSFASYERKGIGKITFKVGDRVLNTHNNYGMPCIDYDEDNEEVYGIMSCMNGDLGICRQVRGNAENPEIIIEFDNGLAAVKGADIGNLLLGYAVSIHRCQGSQSKAVIVVIDEEHKSLLSRNLLYVALSRAQKTMTLIANEAVVADSLKVCQEMERDTYLCDMLKEES